MLRPSLALSILLQILTPLAACSGGDGNGSDRGPGSPDAATAQDCSGVDPAAGPSAECCLAYGEDACGAGLVCAALEGRTIPVCYAERSRASGEDCTEDKLCKTGLCDVEKSVCKKELYGYCRRSDECGLYPFTEQMACQRPTQDSDKLPRCNDPEKIDLDDYLGLGYEEACITDVDCRRPGTTCQDDTPIGYRFCN